MPFIQTDDGTQIHYTDWGKGRPVIMIHGWPLAGQSWSAQAVALAEAGYRVIAYDRRGFGQSDQPWDGYDYDTLSDDLAAIIKGLSLSDVALVGFSMAGGELARYAGRHGNAGVSRMVFVSTIAPGLLQGPENPDGVPQKVFDDMKAGIRKDRAGFIKDFLPGFYGNGSPKGGVSDGVLEWSFNMAMAASLKGTLDCVTAFGTTDLTADVASIRVPVLAIHGTKDATVPIAPTAHRLVKLVPGAELIEYDGAPHGVLATQQDQLTKDLLAFLD